MRSIRPVRRINDILFGPFGLSARYAPNPHWIEQADSCDDIVIRPHEFLFHPRYLLTSGENWGAQHMLDPTTILCSLVVVR